MWNPRMGGEKWAGVEDFMSYIGSPPRGRGKDGVVPADITSRLGSPPPGGENWRTSVTISEMTDYPC